VTAAISNVRPDPDKVLVDIVDYVHKYKVSSQEAYDTARYCLMDTLGCGFEALQFPACTKLLGPIVPAPSCRTARRCRARPTSSTRSTPRSTSER
jgi:2-methylcitrate dehydratase PrpD